jgi:predicted RNA-binding protein YlxR (DUF448 family)
MEAPRTKGASRRVPLRTCVGCRRVTTPDELVRLVADAEGRVLVGRTLPGRGAWLCRGSRGCLEAALRRGKLARALRRELAPIVVEDLWPLVASG